MADPILRRFVNSDVRRSGNRPRIGRVAKQQNQSPPSFGIDRDKSATSVASATIIVVGTTFATATMAILFHLTKVKHQKKLAWWVGRNKVGA
jgi:hypothetical protein